MRSTLKRSLGLGRRWSGQVANGGVIARTSASGVETLESLRAQLQTLKAEKQDIVAMVEEVKTSRDLQDSIDFVASKDITPLNLADLVEYCRQEDYKTHLFLHRELPIRTAIAIQQLSHLPHGFTTMSSTRKVKEWLLEEFQLLTQVLIFFFFEGTAIGLGQCTKRYTV